MGNLKLIVFAMLATIAIVSSGFAAEKIFKASLTGKEMVPSVETIAAGNITFKLSKDGKRLSFRMRLHDIKDPITAHIHRGVKGKNGPLLVNILPELERTGIFFGIIFGGIITAEDLTGDLRGKSLADLIRLIRSGETYVNVHTDGKPDGEIRGQIE